MKAWRVNESEFYAAYTLEEAIRLSMAETGLSREDCLDEAYAGEANPEMRVREDIPGGYRDTTLGALLSEMKVPGLIFAAEV